MAKPYFFAYLLVLGLAQACVARTAPAVELAGCTPGDGYIRQALGISPDTRIDFIRWNLRLLEGNRFEMEVSYGRSKPNTLGFEEDSVLRHISGHYTPLSLEAKSNFSQAYLLQSQPAGMHFSLVKISDNLFHFLDANQRLLVGNGGWSYQLNRTNPVQVEQLFIHSRMVTDTSAEMVFDGRTPCREISMEHPEMQTSAACFKLKWRLILRRDPQTHQPTTYTMRKVVDGVARDVTGSWAIRKGTGAEEGLLIYTLDPDKPEQSISLLAGDENVLIFLDRNQKPYVGNENFSFALNRRLQ